MSEPNALVGRPSSIALHAGVAAVAFAVRQSPPPAAAIHSRQPLPGLPQLGSTASAVTRPEVIESLRLSVVAPGAKGVVGPSRSQSAPTLAAPSALWRNFEAGSRVGRARVARVAERTSEAEM